MKKLLKTMSLVALLLGSTLEAMKGNPQNNNLEKALLVAGGIQTEEKEEEAFFENPYLNPVHKQDERLYESFTSLPPCYPPRHSGNQPFTQQLNRGSEVPKAPSDIQKSTGQFNLLRHKFLGNGTVSQDFTTGSDTVTQRPTQGDEREGKGLRKKCCSSCLIF